MFKHVLIDEVVKYVSEDGWYHLDMNYWTEHPEVTSTVLTAIRGSKRAIQTLKRRYERLNSESRTLAQCPRKGVAVRQPSNQFYTSWLDRLIAIFLDHYGDIIDADECSSDEADAINHFASGKHECFQLPKMGMFAPFSRNSLTKSVNEFTDVSYVDNRDPIPENAVTLALKAMDRVRNEDLEGIPDGSLSVVSAAEAVYGSNSQGLATGYIQLSRDLTLSADEAAYLRKRYQVKVSEGTSVADAIIEIYESTEVKFSVALNVVTNLKRVQVGGLELTVKKLPDKVTPSMFKKAKYRTINANDPIIQVAEASAAIPFREAIKAQTYCGFYNTLLDPDDRWDRLEHMTLQAESEQATLYPLDYSLHDAHLHAEWLFNLMMRIVRPKFREEDRPIIDLIAMCLVYKVVMAPKGRRGLELKYLIGSLGSGDPWTNIIGTLGTRTIGYILAEARPDIFICSPLIGCNNGDDAAYGINKQALEMYGIQTIIQIANDIVNRYHYYFNEDKLMNIKLPGQTYANHWEQYAIWFNKSTQRAERHGSTLRYFGKIYSDEDSGRQGALEGLMDQLSTLNNTVGYVGSQTFTTTTMNLQVLAEFINNDKVLTTYIGKYGQAFFDNLVKDAVEDQVAKLRTTLATQKQTVSDDELRKRAEDKILRHLRISGFDKTGLAKAMHDKDFSFLSITKLAGLGAAELSRIAATGKGRMLRYQVINGKLQWLAA